MSMLECAVRLEQEQYRPGEELVGAFRVDGDPPEQYTIELSVLWRTEGKGDEDLGVVLFQEWSAEGNALEFDRPQPFAVQLPRSPLTYDGELVKIRWMVRVRVRWNAGQEIVAEEPFQLGPGYRAKS
ncbi:MAG: hypothetical protein U0736_27915 [Gemmataceae bacterium]